MPRRGRCHCGAILEFEAQPKGYKTRCRQCGAVVRLRAEATTAPIPQAGPVAPPPLPASSNPFDFAGDRSTVSLPGPQPTPSEPLGPFPDLLPGEVPLIEMEPVSPPARPMSLWSWPLWAGIAVGLLLVVAVVVWWIWFRP